MTHNTWRGHAIKLHGTTWFYCDTGESVKSDPDRKCGHCNKESTTEGHDGCLGTLNPEIVKNACCGHGVTGDAYVQCWDGTQVYGDEAMRLIGVLKDG